jgi:hypothetical protein
MEASWRIYFDSGKIVSALPSRRRLPIESRQSLELADGGKSRRKRLLPTPKKAAEAFAIEIKATFGRVAERQASRQ